MNNMDKLSKFLGVDIIVFEKFKERTMLMPIPYKDRSEPAELVIYRLLNERMNLMEKDKKNFINLQKGFEGEKLFDHWTEALQSNCLVINDLLLNYKGNTFQLDSTLIFQDTIYLFEVKNFEGDHLYDSGSERLYLLPDSEVNNPLIQLKRSESLFRQLLQSLGYIFSIKAFVVFINQDFTMYNTPPKTPFIFSSQMKRFFNKLNAIGIPKLNEKHKKLGDKLISLHMDNFPYKKIPTYNFHQLGKGITCENCHSFNLCIEGYTVDCEDCGYRGKFADAVLRSVREFRILFPEEKITTNVIYEWCNMVESKKRIRTVLQKKYKKVGVKNNTYYV